MLSTREAAAIKSRIACAIGCRCISNGVVMLKMKIEKWLQLMSEASCLEEEGIRRNQWSSFGPLPVSNFRGKGLPVLWPV